MCLLLELQLETVFSDRNATSRSAVTTENAGLDAGIPIKSGLGG